MAPRHNESTIFKVSGGGSKNGAHPEPSVIFSGNLAPRASCKALCSMLARFGLILDSILGPEFVLLPPPPPSNDADFGKTWNTRKKTNRPSHHGDGVAKRRRLVLEPSLVRWFGDGPLHSSATTSRRICFFLQQRQPLSTWNIITFTIVYMKVFGKKI